ncbi:MAG TPA: POTRA domain-containing protein [Candidatus Limnocylindrales bacterium]|nr:POTRA domain-containing protein [Candidatus Limnocylindrales bacterium]
MICPTLYTHGARLFRRWFPACLTLALLASFCPRALSQTASANDASLLSVTEVGSQQYSNAQVAALSGLQDVATVNRDTIQAAADRLAHTGLFSSVRYRYSGDIGGVRITFQLQDAPTFPVSFDNFPWFTDAELSAALTQSSIPFHGEAPATGTILDTMAATLEKTLATRNVHATVEHRVTLVPGTDKKTLQFRVVGADLNVTSVQFSDPLAANDRSIQNELSSLIGKPFSREAVERFDFEHVRPVYFTHSYLRVHFATPEARFNANPLGPPPKSVVVIVPITPGAQYTWGGVTWNGNQAYTTTDLDTLVRESGLASGQLADGMKIFALFQSVQTAYGHRGYLDATVTPAELFNDATHSAAYRVDISEGYQYHMGKLVLSGLSIDAEQRIRKAWRIPQGQIFDKTFYDYFLTKGISDALKGSPAAQDTIEHYLQKNTQPPTVDVMLNFQ